MSTEPNELTAECDRLAEKLKRAEAACAAYVLALRDIGIAAAEFISDWKKGDFQLPRLAQHDAASLDEKLKRHAGVMDIENPGDALLKKQAADTQAHAAEVERAQRAGNNLYLAIVHQMCTNFDGEDRCLEWDVLPFTIKAALKERDTLRSEVERLTKERDEAKATEESSVDFCVGLTGRNIEKVKEALTERAQLRAKAAEDAKEIATWKRRAEEKEKPTFNLGRELEAATARATQAEAACAAKDGVLQKCSTAFHELSRFGYIRNEYGLSNEIDAALATTPAEHLAKLQAAEADAKRLDFVASRSLWISHSRDGECCNVWERYNDEGQDGGPIEGYPQKCYNTPREAIDAAMKEAR